MDPNGHAIYTQSLAVSSNQWIEQVTTNIPFLSIGITALAAVTCLLLTQRLSFPAAAILTAAFLSFNGAIFDFARLLQEAKTGSAANAFAITILREVNFSLALALNYLYFLTFLGRPPRGEVALVNPPDRTRARNESPSGWAYWGITGYIAQGLLGAGIVAVAVLEIIWRVSGNAGGAIYMADGIVQGVLSVAFLGKVVLNTFLSPLAPRWKTARNYLPIILALGIRLGIILASEFCTGFTESSLGRLLQAIQLYIVIVYSLVSPYYSSTSEDEIMEKSAEKRASSFRGLRFSTVPAWSVLDSAPANRVDMPINGAAPRRPSPTQRLSSWLTTRLAPRKDPQEDRLWNKDQTDLEAPQTPGDRPLEDEFSPTQGKYSDRPPSATWQGPFVGEVVMTGESTPNVTTPFSGANGTSITTPGTAKAPALPTTAPESTLPLGTFIGNFEVRASTASSTDSPIYGINGIVRQGSGRQNSQRSRRSMKIDAQQQDDLEQLRKEQAELEKSVASMAAYSPSRETYRDRSPSATYAGFGRARFADIGQRVDSNVTGAPSGSLKSEFSLRDFPSPPAALFNDTRRDTPSPSIPIVAANDAARNPSSIINGGSTGGFGTETVEEVQFAMVPPRMPAASSRRRASFPTVVRESGISSVDDFSRIISTYAESEDDIGGKRVRISGNNNRLDVTSFIGELTTPNVGKGFVPGRSAIRRQNDSIDSRLSPLPEDSSPRPSVEIIDMRIKSPTFSPAVAITTGDGPTASRESSRKISFAPATYNLVRRPGLPAVAVPPNTLPASPRPSPTASPNKLAAFKPTYSSPLAKGNSGPSPPSFTSQSPVILKASNSLTSGNTRPIIKGPYPIRNVNETSDAKGYRRNPPQRF